MTITEVKKIAESADWLLNQETESMLYYMPSIKEMINEGFYGESVPQIGIFFKIHKNDGKYVVEYELMNYENGQVQKFGNHIKKVTL